MTGAGSEKWPNGAPVSDDARMNSNCDILADKKGKKVEIHKIVRDEIQWNKSRGALVAA